MIRVLHISENPIAGAPIRLVKCLNKYHPDLQCRLITASANNGGRVFDYDLLVQDKDETMIKAALNTCDIVHFHNFYKDQALFKKWPSFFNTIAKKPKIWQVHTQRECPFVDLNGFAKSPNFARKLVVAQYHTRQYPECTPVPNIIDIWDPRYLPIQENNNERATFVYTPSNINLKGWDNKGHSFTRPILNQLYAEGYQIKIMIDMPHAETMALRKCFDIGIDQVAVPSYHLCSLENASVGLINVVNMDESCTKALLDVSGATKHPFVLAKEGTLIQVLRAEAARPKEERFNRQRASREWMETYWNPRKLVEQYYSVYRSL